MGHRKNDQLRILGQRFKSLGMSRRNFMKIAAAAAAGTVTTAGMERYVGPGSAAAPRGRCCGRRSVPTRSSITLPSRRSDYFRLEPQPLLPTRREVASGLLTFDADLNAVPDWAETFTPNEDASVWTFNIRPDNQGWTNGTETRPVTAQDFVYSWERQLNPANAAPYAGFLFDIKNAEKYNLGEEGITPEDLG